MCPFRLGWCVRLSGSLPRLSPVLPPTSGRQLVSDAVLASWGLSPSLSLVMSPIFFPTLSPIVSLLVSNLFSVEYLCPLSWFCAPGLEFCIRLSGFVVLCIPGLFPVLSLNLSLILSSSWSGMLSPLACLRSYLLLVCDAGVRLRG